MTNSAGVPWSAAYVDTIGEPTADMRSNIAAEARAKIVYERLMNVTDDPGVKEALGFLMTREIAHQLSFEKALHAIQPNFPQGKLPGMPEFTNVYFNMSQGEGSTRGPWNEGDDWDFVEDPAPAVDGGDGSLCAIERRGRCAAHGYESQGDVRPRQQSDHRGGLRGGSTRRTTTLKKQPDALWRAVFHLIQRGITSWLAKNQRVGI